VRDGLADQFENSTPRAAILAAILGRMHGQVNAGRPLI
jgi:hypothetical protein